jgi:hypothetical protein
MLQQSLDRQTLAGEGIEAGSSIYARCSHWTSRP